MANFISVRKPDVSLAMGTFSTVANEGEEQRRPRCVLLGRPGATASRCFDFGTFDRDELRANGVTLTALSYCIDP